MSDEKQESPLMIIYLQCPTCKRLYSPLQIQQANFPSCLCGTSFDDFKVVKQPYTLPPATSH